MRVFSQGVSVRVSDGRMNQYLLKENRLFRFCLFISIWFWKNNPDPELPTYASVVREPVTWQGACCFVVNHNLNLFELFYNVTL